MLIATMLLMSQLKVFDGLPQDQVRTVQVAQAKADKARASSPPARSGRGQRAPSQSTLDEVRVFRLKHAECHEVLFTLQHMLSDDRVIADDRTNSIIFAGSKEQAAKIEDLLAILDTPADDARPTASLSIISIRNRDARELANEIQNTLGPRSRLKVAADRARSAILLDGERESMLKAESIIRALDTPAATAQLEFSFFKARLNGDVADPKIPEDLQPVAKELRRFGQVRLLGRLSTIATEQEEFQVEGVIAGMISAEVGGVLLSVGEENSVKIRLDTGMALRAQGQASQPSGPKPRFSLRTVVQAQRGEFIVLGSAPNGWESGESAILVLHVPR